MLVVKFNQGDIRIFHKSMMGSLQDLFTVGNTYRHKAGLKPVHLSAWIQRQDVTEYIDYVTKETGEEAIVRRKGKNGGTYARIEILIDAAMTMSVEFKHEIISIFLHQKLCLLRDESGDAYVEMNAMLSLVANSVLGKPAHKGHYIALAQILRKRCDTENWNLADAYQLDKRTRIEQSLASMLKAGVVRDWDHLKDLAEIV
jgi:hypothetical protein